MRWVECSYQHCSKKVDLENGGSKEKYRKAKHQAKYAFYLANLQEKQGLFTQQF